MTAISYLRFDKTNTYVTGTGFSSKGLPENSMLSPCPVNPQQYQRHYLVEGNLVPRPQAPEPEQLNDGWVIRNCSDQTLIEIFDLIGEEVLLEIFTEGDCEFSLPDAGSYRVDVTPPLPAVPSKTKIEVV